MEELTQNKLNMIKQGGADGRQIKKDDNNQNKTLLSNINSGNFLSALWSNPLKVDTSA